MVGWSVCPILFDKTVNKNEYLPTNHCEHNHLGCAYRFLPLDRGYILRLLHEHPNIEGDRKEERNASLLPT